MLPTSAVATMMKKMIVQRTCLHTGMWNGSTSEHWVHFFVFDDVKGDTLSIVLAMMMMMIMAFEKDPHFD